MSRPNFSQEMKTALTNAVRFAELTNIAAEDAPSRNANPAPANIPVTNIPSMESGGTATSSARARRFQFARAIARNMKRGAIVRIIPI